MNAETQTSLYLDSSDQTPTDTRRRLCLSAVAAAALGSSFGLAGCASPQLALEWRDEAVKPVTASKIIILAQHPDVVIERVCEDLMSEAIGKAGVAAVAGTATDVLDFMAEQCGRKCQSPPSPPQLASMKRAASGCYGVQAMSAATPITSGLTLKAWLQLFCRDFAAGNGFRPPPK
ncbi:MAG: hypothetical protein EBX56_12690 [Betaproteobacteria bacterium]|nr:hypothetical protein [Betaproteobacteria bacterium]